MSIVIAATVLVGALCLLDLLLTLAVLRRLREHTAELGRLSGGGTGGVPGFDRDALVGLPLPEHATVGGGSVSVVGFFAAGCEPCHKQAPELADWASGLQNEPAGTAARAIAVVTGTGSEAEDLVETLGDAVTVIAEPDSSQIAAELGVKVFPTFVRTDAGGAITEAAVSMRDVLDRRRLAEPGRA